MNGNQSDLPKSWIHTKLPLFLPTLNTSAHATTAQQNVYIQGVQECSIPKNAKF